MLPERQRHGGPSSQLPAVKTGGSLFRQEAILGQAAPQQGKVFLRPLIGSGRLMLLSLAAAAAIMALLVMGTYTRRATVEGSLVPVGGVVRLLAPAVGQVISQAVRDGQRVTAGEVLFVLSTDRPTVDGSDYQGQVVDSLRRRSASLTETGAQQRVLAQAEREALMARAASMRRELGVVQTQLAEQQRRAALAEDTRNRWRTLLDQALVPREQWLQKDAELSEQRARLQTLTREQLVLTRELATTEATLASTGQREAEQQQLLLREREQMRQQSAENEARRRIVITAPRDGVITLVQATQGMVVDAQRPLAHLLPADAALLVHLFAPSRAVGHVKPGTPVWLRYEAFPFERYGQQQAVVVAVSSSPATPEELSPWQGGLPGQVAAGSANPGEPLYLITARLQPAAFNPGAGQVVLRSGMRVHADLMFETRRLIEWMLGPALRITGKGTS